MKANWSVPGAWRDSRLARNRRSTADEEPTGERRTMFGCTSQSS